MKPIKLEVKGLNSFIEEQTIDFNKLTDRGLFGIFGPTGSGKSTILDGITLALYGDIARKSSNFINTNCNDLNVSFTFQISGTPNRIYRVSRHFKRDKKTGNAKTHSASVKELIGDTEEVLAESVKGVTDTCKNILGLSLEDFTRTVVLPQGKFSDFLKLEGKQRREMLERLFNLQDYGDKLSIKLARKIKSQNDEANRVLGELNSYEGISDEKLAEEKQCLEGLTATLNQAKKQQEEVESRYKRGEEIWKMQSDLATYKVRQAELEAQAETIEKQTQRVKQGESAAKVYPFLEEHETTKKALKVCTEECARLEENQKVLTLQKQEVEAAYEKANKEKEERLPDFKMRLTQLEEALSETKKLGEIEAFVHKVELGLYKVVDDIEKYGVQEKECTDKIDKLQNKISSLQEEEKQYKVEESIRTKVQEGLRLTQAHSFNQSSLDKSTATYNESMALKIAVEAQKAEINNVLAQKRKELEEQLYLQEHHQGQVPLTREELSQKQGQLTVMREKHSRLEKLKIEMQQSANKLQNYEVEKQQLQNLYNERKESLEEAQGELEQLKMKNLAHLLRAKLQDGMSCPVCGSTSHHLDHLETVTNTELEILEAKVKEIEDLYKKAEAELTQIQMLEGSEGAQFKRIQEELSPLEEVFKETSIEEYEKNFILLDQALSQFEEKKLVFEKGITTLREENLRFEAQLGQAQAKLDENQKQSERLVLEMTETKKQIEQIKQALDDLKQEVNTTDFMEISQEIVEKDRKREVIVATISKQNEEREYLMKERDKIREYLKERQIKLGNGMTAYDENQKQRQEFLKSIGKRLQVILSKSQDESTYLNKMIDEMITFLNQNTELKELLRGKKDYISVQTVSQQEISRNILDKWFAIYPLIGEIRVVFENQFTSLTEMINDRITHIEQSFVAVKGQKEEIDDKYENNSKLLVEAQANFVNFTNRVVSQKEMLEKQLREENLLEEEVKLYLLTKEEIEALKQGIKQYQEEQSKLIGSIEAIEGKLGNQRLEEAQWLALQEERKAVLEQVEILTKDYIGLMNSVKHIEETLVKLGELRGKKQQIDHQLAILADLDKLFKGKRFVEFVATNRLKYVSLEASKKLREITNGIYGLEVDEDGKFLIRDYKNGGARRDASTLSGGETFLASLALALALSAEIQLKGTAPLELFFLDEGFGTLDDDLLEVVMSSLEKIHHDKLKVGIISHVEAIKNRVPVKLLLTPAEAGKGGTKVKLERS